MKARLFFSATLMLASALVGAQELDVLVNSKGKMGYADASGAEVIKCVYDNATPFREGAAVVAKGSKYGMIDQSGNVVLPMQYSDIRPWNDHLYLVIKGGKTMGLVDLSGKVVLEPVYSLISNLNCYDRAVIGMGGKQKTNDSKPYMNGAKYGIINGKGEVLISAEYKGLHEFTYDCSNVYPYYEGMRTAYDYHYLIDTLKTDCQYLAFSYSDATISNAGVMDGNGKVLMPVNTHDLVMLPMNGMIRYFDRLKSGFDCGYYNIEKGQTIKVSHKTTNFNDAKYWSHGDFYGKIAPVNGSTWQFVDKDGKVVKDGYTSLQHVPSMGLWIAKTSAGTYDVLDADGNVQEMLTGYNAFKCSSKAGDPELFSVGKDGKYGVIDRSGNVVIPMVYDMTSVYNYGLFGVCKDKKWGYVTTENKVVVPMEFDNLKIPSTEGATQFWIQKADKKWYHYNSKNGKTGFTGFKKVWNFDGDFAYVVLDGVEDIYAVMIDVNDQFVVTTPVLEAYRPAVMAMVKANGGKKLTAAQNNNIMLMMTRAERQYEMDTVIPQKDWDY